MIETDLMSHIPTQQMSNLGSVSKLPTQANPRKFWTRKIRVYLDALVTHKNDECRQVENLMKEKFKILANLQEENTFELEILKNKDKLLANATEKQTRSRKTLPTMKTDQISKLESEIKAQVMRRDELSQWGFNSYVISYRLKVRTMEVLIDRAQRLKQGGSAITVQEL